MGKALSQLAAICGALFLSLIMSFGMLTPLSFVDRREPWTEPYIYFDDFGHSGCVSFDLPPAFLLEPHARNRHVTYSWRTLPPETLRCID